MCLLFEVLGMPNCVHTPKERFFHFYHDRESEEEIDGRYLYSVVEEGYRLL